MKKIIAIALAGSLMCSSQLLAEESNIYIGIDGLTNSNTFTLKNTSTGAEADVDVDSNGFKLKVGVEYSSGWRMQGYYLGETYDSPLFDATNDYLNEIGIDFIKGFKVTPEFSPFIQVGLGYGWMNVDGYTEDSISSVSVKIGAGVMYKVTPEIELLAGIDLQRRRWADITIGTTTIETTEQSTKIYAGVNFHF